MDERVIVEEDDTGKPVVGPDGETVGIVTNVRAGRAYVDPDPHLTDRIRARLGWESVDERDYALPDAAIERIDEDAIRLNERPDPSENGK